MLNNLIRYTAVADALIIDTFLRSDKELPEACNLFSHILNAQHIWVSRINGVPPKYRPWDQQQISSFTELHNNNIAGITQAFVTGNIERIVQYHTFAGDALEDSVGDMLLHVANHSTYHRAQVASSFRRNGIEPPATDFIHLKRKGLI